MMDTIDQVTWFRSDDRLQMSRFFIKVKSKGSKWKESLQLTFWRLFSESRTFLAIMLMRLFITRLPDWRGVNPVNTSNDQN